MHENVEEAKPHIVGAGEPGMRGWGPCGRPLLGPQPVPICGGTLD